MEEQLTSDELRTLGISRVARLTGLDRTGVEVACSVRPTGHVLQVCNGKGLGFEQAALGAAMEAAELWGAERLDPAQLRFASAEELRADVGDEVPVWAPDMLDVAGSAARRWTPRCRMSWRSAVQLQSGAPVLVPAQAVHCPPAASALWGPTFLPWTSNGMGAHRDPEAAVLHALLEAVERDQLARSLPRFWTRPELSRRMLSLDSFDSDSPARQLAEDIGSRGFGVFLFDLTPSKGIGLPVGGALLLDRERGPVPLTAGYACRLGRDEALVAALLEAAQSRLTDIHGAREDVTAAEGNEVEQLRQWCRGVRPKRAIATMPEVLVEEGASSLEPVVSLLEQAGHEQIAVVSLAPPSLALHVVKVLVPGLLRSELL